MSETLAPIEQPTAGPLPEAVTPNPAEANLAAAEEATLATFGISQEFQDITSQLHDETELDTRSTLKAQAAEALRPSLDSLDADSVPGYLAAFNETYRGVFDGEGLRLVSSSKENLVIVNDKGELEALKVTPENAEAMLNKVKAVDSELHGPSHDLRREIMKRSFGQILSHEAFTYAEALPTGSELDTYLDNPENWVPERRQLHEAIVNHEYELAQKLSERLNDDKPAVYALRGNTAAGKTTAVRNNETFAKALDENGEPSGSINPDTYKSEIKQYEVDGEVQTVSHFQAHEEGSMLARKIQGKIAESESSMVIDKRMSKTKNIEELVRLAEKSGKEIKLLDVDVPLDISLVRVLERNIGGEAPNVPFDAVAQGFVEIRDSRSRVIEMVETNDKITDYVLNAADETGTSIQVARKIDGKLYIAEGQEQRYINALDSGSTRATVEQLAQTVITDEFINVYLDRVFGNNANSAPYRQVSEVALTRYKGKTLKQALDTRASTLNAKEGE